MITLFKKLFIKDYQDTTNPLVRARYGTAAGALGIVANIILFVGKFIAGLLSGSVAVIADAINNLSDFMTSIITLIGFKLSGKPADKEHPYGHARIEYITGLIVAFIILYIGIEVGKTAIDKIIAPSPTDFSLVTCIILGSAIIIKLFLAIIFKNLGKSINSDTLIAMSTDSRNDVISTFVVLVSAVVAIVFNVALDGYLGVCVAIFIIISAIKLIKETIDPLVGTPPEKDLVKKVEAKIRSYPQILGIHDLVIHNYGPSKIFATVHIEVDAQEDVMVSHELSDNIERDFFNEMNIFLVCHLDPIATNDPETNELKHKITTLLKDFDDALALHDFRIVQGTHHTNIIFDVVLQFDSKHTENEIKELVKKELSTYEKKYFAVIEFDRDYT